MPKLLLCADLHLRDDVPVCRTDNFLDTQRKKLEQITELAAKYRAIILCGGDLLDSWKPTHRLVSELISKLPHLFTVAGQHELPYHSYKEYAGSALCVLEKAEALAVLEAPVLIAPGVMVEGVCWGNTPSGDELGPGLNVLIWHRMVWNRKPPFPGADPEGDAIKILRAYPMYDLILTGDNHQQFVVEEKGRILVNPGPMTRQTAAEADLEPAVYLYDTNTRKLTRHPLGYDPGAVSREHIDRITKRQETLTEFVAALESGVDDPLDFAKAVGTYVKRNKIEKEVQEELWRILDTAAGT